MKEIISVPNFKEIEMKFSENWEKLNWVIFTTIRKNTGRYKLGNVYTMVLPNCKFKARVVGILPIKKKEITNDLAKIDADTTKEGLIHMLEKWYGKKFDDYILITLWGM